MNEMTREETLLLAKIDRLLRSENVRAKILPVIERVRTELARRLDRLMTWETIPLAVFGEELGGGIKSGWVFVLRAGADTGVERHPNSHQRMMTWEGAGDMRVGELGRLQSNLLIGDQTAPLQKRWISIPQNVWHQPVIGKDSDWVVISFHTVPAEELIEERPDSASASGTKQMVYLEEHAPSSSSASS